ncbi:hypothetical protein I7I48_06676 [Histoplasma ohiense]|nr:hypothetical protein I7I48_06676 [Histoplasma ohiense (nom. inval.)]
MPGLSTIYSVCIADVEVRFLLPENGVSCCVLVLFNLADFKTMVLLPTRHLARTMVRKQILASLVGMKSEPKERVHLQCGILRKPCQERRLNYWQKGEGGGLRSFEK